MMVGSFLINCWGSLFAFTIYFLFTFQNGIPSKVLIGSFIAAAITFVLMYPFRLLLGFIFYTPQDISFEEMEENEEDTQFDENLEVHTTSTMNFSDENPEEIAKVVKTMINQEEPISIE